MSVWKTIVQEDKKSQKTARVQVEKTLTYHQMRRILSEKAIEESELPWHFEQGISYHCLSQGDVDSLTYLRLVVKQQHIKYAFITTWCMSKVDIDEIFIWVEKGYIDRIDFYVGEIFKSTYEIEYATLSALCKKHKFKLVILRNHSKIIAMFGDNFDCVVEASANVNTNPRIEQAVITVDSKLAHWYKEIFDGMTPFNLDFQQPENYQFGGESDGQTANSNCNE